MTPRGRPWGVPYRPTGRRGERTRWYWLKVKLPGDTCPRRMATKPRTDDEAEAWRQVHAMLGEHERTRVERRRTEDLTVHDLCDFVALDYADKGQTLQPGRLEPWREALGDVLARDVTTDDVEAACRRWRRRGPMWRAGERVLADGTTLAWPARAPERVRPLSGASCNRLVAALRRGYTLARRKRGLVTPLVFPRYEEGRRGEYITEDQCRAIAEHFQARRGAAQKADVFRLGYLLGIRKGQLLRTRKRHVLVSGATWKLRWPGEETKNGEPHEVLLVGEAQAIVARAWAARRPDCDLLFHVEGRPLGPMRSELERTCALLAIPYGRGRGIVFHDTRHSAVTNLVGAGVPEAVAMSITGHADHTVFRRYNVRRDDVQAEALARQDAYLTGKRGAAEAPRPIRRRR